MERRKSLLIPRPEGEAGYGEKKKFAHTPPEVIGGVWGEEKACPYPAQRARRGMERRKGLLIPRPEGEAGYGEKKRFAHTPPEVIGGVWGEEKACLYPARRNRRGMGRRKGISIPHPE